MNGRYSGLVLGMVIASLVLAACGGGGGGGGGQSPGTQTTVYSKGVMLKGSVIVNGIRFEDTAANITADDTPKTAAFLQSGMVVRVKGKRNDDGLTGTAEKIQVENEVRGAIASKGTDTFSVHGQTVQVSGATVFANVANFAALIVSDAVEVYGLRDATGVIHATRVEKLGAAGVDELRGVVSGLTGTLPDAATFSINGFSITTNGSTTLAPAGSAVLNGTLVEVNLSGSVATRITVEDAADAEFEPTEGQEFEVEGYVNLFTGPSATFRVNDRVVSLSSSVRYEGGVAADLGNGVKVEAEGHVTGGILVAHKITFKENIKIKAIPTSVTPTSNPVPDLTMLGLTVKASSTTQSTASIINTSSRLEVRGFLNLDGTVTAVRIKDGSGGDPFLQGVVNNINASARTFTIAGVTINAGSAIGRPNDDSGNETQTMSLDSFFASLSAGRTVVKAKGPYTSGTNSIAATEVEIE